jgi:large subunit ribosomal protein L31
MKEKIHPKYFKDAVVICSCGNRFTTGSTKKELHVEVCSNCHPFFTGERRMLDTTGRVERFKKRYKIES